MSYLLPFYFGFFLQLYSLWVDSRNFTEFSRPLYAKKCAFPLNFIVPGRLYKSSYDFLQVTKLNASKTTDVIGEEVPCL